MSRYIHQFHPQEQDSNSAPVENNGLQALVTIHNALSVAQCGRLIQEVESKPLVRGNVSRGTSLFRDCEIAWLNPSGSDTWLADIVTTLFQRASTELGIEIRGLLDPLQYTVYGARQHYHWHMDLGPGAASARKISLSLQLSDPKDYAGGKLEFAHAPETRISRQQGSAILFPAFMTHRVTPVVSGKRRSLVAWACGPAFR